MYPEHTYLLLCVHSYTYLQVFFSSTCVDNVNFSSRGSWSAWFNKNMPLDQKAVLTTLSNTCNQFDGNIFSKSFLCCIFGQASCNKLDVLRFSMMSLLPLKFSCVKYIIYPHYGYLHCGMWLDSLKCIYSKHTDISAEESNPD